MLPLPNRQDNTEEAAPIDLVHLRSQTLGDRALEADLLDLFAVQAERIIADLAAAPGPAPAARQHRADLLHRLCGSARAIGAWKVAAGAERLEREERREPCPQPETPAPSGMEALDSSVASACQSIAILRHSGDPEG